MSLTYLSYRQDNYWLQALRAPEKSALVKLSREAVSSTLKGMETWIKNNPNAPTRASVEYYLQRFQQLLPGMDILSAASIITIANSTLKLNTQPERDTLAKAVSLFAYDKEFLNASEALAGRPDWKKAIKTEKGWQTLWDYSKPWTYFMSLNWTAKNIERIKTDLGVAKAQSAQRIESFDNFIKSLEVTRNFAFAVPAVAVGLFAYLALRKAT